MRFSLPSVAVGLLSLSSLVTADITSALATTTADNAAFNPTPAATNAVPGEGALGYQYVGCYNETTGFTNAGGVRALSPGSNFVNDSQTTLSCLTFCKGNDYQYCGMQYGNECWGGRYMSSLSTELPAENCSIGCGGNNTQICGGRLTYSLYNVTGEATEGAGTKEIAGAVGAVVLAGLMGVMFVFF